MKVREHGVAVQRWRKRRGLTQRELAFLVKKSQTTIYLIESGQLITISEPLALEIARRLDVPWEELFELRESSRGAAVTNGGHIAARATA
ncbi:MAG: helix-turn-helix transcriptional regulator [Jatrophihabitans sp.]|uniref:helix-turn-helix transcriptional regulator n=1 Tax=Jatrophihabitans sp. TaxID=1932789 RepID=UPI003F7F8AE9